MAKKENACKDDVVDAVEVPTTEIETEEVEQPEGVDALSDLQAQLEQAQSQAAGYLDGWQRAQAEFSNYKKRQEAERARMIALASSDVLRKLLPALDDLERALATLPDELVEHSWSEGVMLIKRKLDTVFESEGITEIEAVGQMFDPRIHEAVTYEEAPGYEEGQIIDQVQRGYLMGEQVLRPALVRVAKAMSVQPEPDEVFIEMEDSENKE